MRYTFGDCAFDTHLFTVQRAGQTWRLRPKVFQLLLYLVVHRDRVVGKPELCDQVWPGQFISEATLESHLRLVRQAIGDSGRAQRFIQTRYGHGYRFIGVVAEHDAALPAAVAQTTPSLPYLMPKPVPEATAATAVAVSPPLEQTVRPLALQEVPMGLEVDRGDSGNRQLTVLVCHLTEVPALAIRLEPEALHSVLRAYHTTCTAVVARFGGYVVQSLGESLVVYFGFPQAHEDDARRAVHTGLALLNTLAQSPGEVVSTTVRVGIHTSPVVVIASEPAVQLAVLAIGEAPQLAAHLARQAAPQTVVISATTWRLVAGWFVGEALETQPLPGLPQPVPGYCVRYASGAQSALEAVGPERLTPLVGRTAEMAVLQERWAQAREGLGQVVMLSGEAGIGKSRLAEVLRAQVAAAGYPQSVLRCSPYHTHSPLYPVIVHMQRLARWHREDSPVTKLDKLEQVLREYGLALEPMVPLLAALLSVPLLERYPPVSLTPPQHKQQTQEALVTWLRTAAERQPVLLVWEDLHWADPSTLELLTLWIDQVPTMRVLILLLYRPEFRPPWSAPAHCSQLTLSRFTRAQVEEMLAYLTRAQSLPEAVREQVITRADGVPLFLEELVKTLLEATPQPTDTGHGGRTARRPLPAIPPTLQDALMARLDRLESARDLALLGATWGREFTYAQLQALVPLEETTLERQLGKLVEGEILYQRGLPPRASYRFKHALIQETAYHSLLQSTRQQYHQRIAQVLEIRMPETVETQPELLAHHYTEAGLPERAIPYWQRAGERALARAANLEAIRHLTKGLEVLETLPDTPERLSQELHLQLPLGSALAAAKGFAAPEVEQAYSRAKELCQQVEDTARLLPVLRGLGVWYMNRAQLQSAREVVEQGLHLARRQQDPVLIMGGHLVLGSISYHAGEFAAALAHIEQALHADVGGADRRNAGGLQPNAVVPLSHAAWALWCMGYADQSLTRSQEALGLAEKLGTSFFLVNAFYWAAQLHQFRRDRSRTQALAEATIAFSTEQGFTQQIGQGMFLRGWALAIPGQAAVGLSQMRQGFAAWEATGAEVLRPYYLALLAEVSAEAGEINLGLELLDKALVVLAKSGEHSWKAEVHRLKGELLLKQVGRVLLQSAVTEEAEAWLYQAMTIARRQEAKALELRAARSLARLWQKQGKGTEARALLAPIYGWFTEGLDTADLQEARTLLEVL